MNVIGTPATMLCCICGLTIQQNPANMCVNCIRNTVDVTEEINKKVTIYSCRHCGRFMGPPWKSVQLESKELMAMCLRKINGLNKVKLIDAQAAIVEFTIRNQQCKECEQNFAQGAWHAIVQLRQRVQHKRTFFYLEQLILKYEAHMECVKIVTFKDGMDFYFSGKNQALRFIDFLNSHVPTKSKYSRQLISSDIRNNTANYKHNFLLEIAPICKDDLLVLPKDLARNCRNIQRLVLVQKVSAGIHVLDPTNGERVEINAEKYWRHSFRAVMSSKQLIRYVVLSVEPVLGQFDLPLSSQGSVASHATPASHAVWEASSQGSGTMGSRARRSRLRGLSSGSGVHRKTRLAECVVARERDLGVNDTQFTCVTHLGNILKEGDVVLGYDFTVANWNLDDETEDVLEHEQRPDLVLVQKSYEASKESKRKFELKKLPVDEGVGLSAAELKAQEEDYELFMREVETDKELRAKMNLFKKRSTAAALSGGAMQVEGAGPADGGGCGGGGGDDDDDDDDENGVRLDELLDELALAGSVAAAAAAAGHKHTAAFAASAMMPPPLPAPSAGPHMETIIELEEPLIVSSDVAASTPAFSFGAAGGGTGAGSRSQVSDSFNAGSYDPTAMKFL